MTTSHDAGIQLRWRYVAAGRTAPITASSRQPTPAHCGARLARRSQPTRASMLIVDPYHPNIVYAAFGVSQLTGRGAGVFASTDDGSSWNPRNTGLIDFTITAVYRMGKFTS
jgi:hypothetical protein